jgi:hypothetical protein
MIKHIGMVLLGAVALAGCYNTNEVKNGGLVCGANDACPEGFRCLKDGASGASGHCVRKDGSRLSDGGADTSAPRTDANLPLACTAPAAPFGPFAGCQVTRPNEASVCDPVCQAGCACDRRCVIDQTAYDKFLCEPAAASAPGFVAAQGDCGGDRYTSCAPGSLCIADDLCPWQCFRTCREDADCPSNSACSLLSPLDRSGDPLPNVWLCTPPTETCNPTGTAPCASGRANFACVFLAGLTNVTNTDATVCDCTTLHTRKLGSACTRAQYPDECAPGLACVDGYCRQVCDRQAPGQVCASGGCSAIYGSARWGYCR